MNRLSLDGITPSQQPKQKDKSSASATPMLSQSLSSRSANRTNTDISGIMDKNVSDANKHRKSIGKRQLSVNSQVLSDFQSKYKR